MFLLAPSINLLLENILEEKDGIAEVLMGKFAATMIVIAIIVSFSGIVTNIVQKSIFEIGLKKA